MASTQLPKVQTPVTLQTLPCITVSTMEAATVGTALALTMMGAAGTGLGGLMVVIQPNMSFKRLGILQVGSASAVVAFQCLSSS